MTLSWLLVLRRHQSYIAFSSNGWVDNFITFSRIAIANSFSFNFLLRTLTWSWAVIVSSWSQIFPCFFLSLFKKIFLSFFSASIFFSALLDNFKLIYKHETGNGQLFCCFSMSQILLLDIMFVFGGTNSLLNILYQSRQVLVITEWEAVPDISRWMLLNSYFFLNWYLLCSHKLGMIMMLCSDKKSESCLSVILTCFCCFTGWVFSLSELSRFHSCSHSHSSCCLHCCSCRTCFCCQNDSSHYCLCSCYFLLLPVASQKSHQLSLLDLHSCWVGWVHLFPQRTHNVYRFTMI